LDTIDVLIFCEMSFKYFDYAGKNRRPSPTQIGEKLGIDEKTVRLRTRRMERDGFIQYYQAVPNLSLFNRPLACLCNFQATDIMAKQRALERLRSAEDIIDIADYLGENFGVTISASTQNDAHNTARRIAEQIGIDRFVLLPPRHFSTPQKTLDKLDWQIVRSLRYNALKQIKDIASEIAVTHRMADYSIKKLFESHALSTRAIINARDPKGIIFYSLNLTIDESTRDSITRKLRELYGERMWWSFLPPGPTTILLLFATSIGKAEDDLLEALNKPGVQSGSLAIFKGWIEPEKPSWIDNRLREKIET
jgi:DNA-binding Lrp family transcriptional regulator